MNWGIYLSPSIQVFPKALQCKGSCLSPATALELLYLKTFKAFVQREVTHQKAQKHKLERFFLCGSFLIHEALQAHVQLEAARYPSMFHVNLVKLHHTYTRDPACGGQARLACLSNGVFRYVSEFSRYLINYSTV